MKRQWNYSGATFLEIIIALAILALIIAPFMTAFVFSERGMVEAGELLDATFIAQRRLESIRSLDFSEAVDEGENIREMFEGVFIKMSAVPYHPDYNNVFNLVVQDQDNDRNNLFVATPTGGEIRMIDELTIDVTIRLNINGDHYEITVPGSTALTGSLLSGNVLVMLNASQYSMDRTVTLNIQTVGRTVDVHIYDTFANRERINIQGLTPLRFPEFTDRNFSLLKARVSVFESLADTEPKAVMESIFDLPN